jgi:hypothetical protein
MNFTTEYQELTHSQTGEKGIFARLNNSEIGEIAIIAGIDSQLTRRIVYLVSNGVAQFQSLEEGLSLDDDLFMKEFKSFKLLYEPHFNEYIYIHENFR